MDEEHLATLSREELSTHVKSEPLSSSEDSSDDNSDEINNGTDNEEGNPNLEVACNGTSTADRLLNPIASTEGGRSVGASQRDEKDGDALSQKQDEDSTGQLFYRCKYCCLKFKHVDIVIEHEAAHENLKRDNYTCQFCSFKHCSMLRVLEHETKHTGEKPFSCDECSFTARHQVDVIKHARVHSSYKKYSCHLCPFRSKWKSNLDKHLKSHTENRPFSCSLCDKRFKCKFTLKSHAGTHDCQKNFTCDSCGFKARTKFEIKNHELSHSDVRKYPCTFPNCQQKCKTNSDLLKHMAVHVISPKYKCDTCQRSYKDKYRLTKHLREHRERGTIPPCSVCGKVLSSKTGYRQHMSKHRNSKKYSCTICGNVFQTAGNLKNHTKVHDVTRTFPCPICSFRLKELDHLLTHIGIYHSDFYTYVCELCKKSFRKYTHIRLHIQRCHKGLKTDGTSEFIYNPDHFPHFPEITGNYMGTTSDPAGDKRASYEVTALQHVEKELDSVANEQQDNKTEFHTTNEIQDHSNTSIRANNEESFAEVLLHSIIESDHQTNIECATDAQPVYGEKEAQRDPQSPFSDHRLLVLGTDYSPSEFTNEKGLYPQESTLLHEQRDKFSNGEGSVEIMHMRKPNRNTSQSCQSGYPHITAFSGINREQVSGLHALSAEHFFYESRNKNDNTFNSNMSHDNPRCTTTRWHQTQNSNSNSCNLQEVNQCESSTAVNVHIVSSQDEAYCNFLYKQTSNDSERNAESFQTSKSGQTCMHGESVMHQNLPDSTLDTKLKKLCDYLYSDFSELLTSRTKFIGSAVSSNPGLQQGSHQDKHLHVHPNDSYHRDTCSPQSTADTPSHQEWYSNVYASHQDGTQDDSTIRSHINTCTTIASLSSDSQEHSLTSQEIEQSPHLILLGSQVEEANVYQDITSLKNTEHQPSVQSHQVSTDLDGRDREQHKDLSVSSAPTIGADIVDKHPKNFTGQPELKDAFEHEQFDSCMIMGKDGKSPAPKVIKLGTIFGIGVCLVSKDSGITFNLEKTGKKVKGCFLEPSSLSEKKENISKFLARKHVSSSHDEQMPSLKKRYHDEMQKVVETETCTMQKSDRGTYEKVPRRSLRRKNEERSKEVPEVQHDALKRSYEFCETVSTELNSEAEIAFPAVSDVETWQDCQPKEGSRNIEKSAQGNHQKTTQDNCLLHPQTKRIKQNKSCQERNNTGKHSDEKADTGQRKTGLPKKTQKCLSKSLVSSQQSVTLKDGSNSLDVGTKSYNVIVKKKVGRPRKSQKEVLESHFPFEKSTEGGNDQRHLQLSKFTANGNKGQPEKTKNSFREPKSLSPKKEKINCQQRPSAIHQTSAQKRRVGRPRKVEHQFRNDENIMIINNATVPAGTFEPRPSVGKKKLQCHIDQYTSLQHAMKTRSSKWLGVTPLRSMFDQKFTDQADFNDYFTDASLESSERPKTLITRKKEDRPRKIHLSPPQDSGCQKQSEIITVGQKIDQQILENPSIKGQKTASKSYVHSYPLQSTAVESVTPEGGHFMPSHSSITQRTTRSRKLQSPAVDPSLGIESMHFQHSCETLMTRKLRSNSRVPGNFTVSSGCVSAKTDHESQQLGKHQVKSRKRRSSSSEKMKSQLSKECHVQHSGKQMVSAGVIGTRRESLNYMKNGNPSSTSVQFRVSADEVFVQKLATEASPIISKDVEQTVGSSIVLNDEAPKNLTLEYSEQDPYVTLPTTSPTQKCDKPSENLSMQKDGREASLQTLDRTPGNLNVKDTTTVTNSNRTEDLFPHMKTCVSYNSETLKFKLWGSDNDMSADSSKILVTHDVHDNGLAPNAQRNKFTPKTPCTDKGSSIHVSTVSHYAYDMCRFQDTGLDSTIPVALDTHSIKDTFDSPDTGVDSSKPVSPDTQSVDNNVPESLVTHLDSYTSSQPVTGENSEVSVTLAACPVDNNIPEIRAAHLLDSNVSEIPVINSVDNNAPEIPVTHSADNNVPITAVTHLMDNVTGTPVTHLVDNNVPVTPVTHLVDNNVPVTPVTHLVDNNAPVTPVTRLVDNNVPVTPVTHLVDNNIPVTPVTHLVDNNVPVTPVTHLVDNNVLVTLVTHLVDNNAPVTPVTHLVDNNVLVTPVTHLVDNNAPVTPVTHLVDNNVPVTPVTHLDNNVPVTPVIHLVANNVPLTPVTHLMDNNAPVTPVTHLVDNNAPVTPVTHLVDNNVLVTPVTHSVNTNVSVTPLTHLMDNNISVTPLTHSEDDNVRVTPHLEDNNPPMIPATHSVDINVPITPPEDSNVSEMPVPHSMNISVPVTPVTRSLDNNEPDTPVINSVDNFVLQTPVTHSEDNNEPETLVTHPVGNNVPITLVPHSVDNNVPGTPVPHPVDSNVPVTPVPHSVDNNIPKVSLTHSVDNHVPMIPVPHPVGSNVSMTPDYNLSEAPVTLSVDNYASVTLVTHSVSNSSTGLIISMNKNTCTTLFECSNSEQTNNDESNMPVVDMDTNTSVTTVTHSNRGVSNTPVIKSHKEKMDNKGKCVQTNLETGLLVQSVTQEINFEKSNVQTNINTVADEQLALSEAGTGIQYDCMDRSEETNGTICKYIYSETIVRENALGQMDANFQTENNISAGLETCSVKENHIQLDAAHFIRDLDQNCIDQDRLQTDLDSSVDDRDYKIIDLNSNNTDEDKTQSDLESDGSDETISSSETACSELFHTDMGPRPSDVNRTKLTEEDKHCALGHVDKNFPLRHADTEQVVLDSPIDISLVKPRSQSSIDREMSSNFEDIDKRLNVANGMKEDMPFDHSDVDQEIPVDNPLLDEDTPVIHSDVNTGISLMFTDYEKQKTVCPTDISREEPEHQASNNVNANIDKIHDDKVQDKNETSFDKESCIGHTNLAFESLSYTAGVEEVQEIRAECNSQNLTDLYNTNKDSDNDSTEERRDFNTNLTFMQQGTYLSYETNDTNTNEQIMPDEARTVFQTGNSFANEKPALHGIDRNMETAVNQEVFGRDTYFCPSEIHELCVMQNVRLPFDDQKDVRGDTLTRQTFVDETVVGRQKTNEKTFTDLSMTVSQSDYAASLPCNHFSVVPRLTTDINFGASWPIAHAETSLKSLNENRDANSFTSDVQLTADRPKPICSISDFEMYDDDVDGYIRMFHEHPMDANIEWQTSLTESERQQQMVICNNEREAEVGIRKGDNQRNVIEGDLEMFQELPMSCPESCVDALMYADLDTGYSFSTSLTNTGMDVCHLQPPTALDHQQCTAFDHPLSTSLDHPQSTALNCPQSTALCNLQSTVFEHPRSTALNQPQFMEQYHPLSTSLNHPQSRAHNHPKSTELHYLQSTAFYQPQSTALYQPQSTVLNHSQPTALKYSQSTALDQTYTCNNTSVILDDVETQMTNCNSIDYPTDNVTSDKVEERLYPQFDPSELKPDSVVVMEQISKSPFKVVWKTKSPVRDRSIVELETPKPQDNLLHLGQDLLRTGPTQVNVTKEALANEDASVGSNEESSRRTKSPVKSDENPGHRHPVCPAGQNTNKRKSSIKIITSKMRLQHHLPVSKILENKLSREWYLKSRIKKSSKGFIPHHIKLPEHCEHFTFKDCFVKLTDVGHMLTDDTYVISKERSLEGCVRNFNSGCGSLEASVEGVSTHNASVENPCTETADLSVHFSKISNHEESGDNNTDDGEFPTFDHLIALGNPEVAPPTPTVSDSTDLSCVSSVTSSSSLDYQIVPSDSDLAALCQTTPSTTREVTAVEKQIQDPVPVLTKLAEPEASSILALSSLFPTTVFSSPLPTSVLPSPLPTTVLTSPLPTPVLSRPLPTTVLSRPLPIAVLSSPLPTTVLSRPLPTTVLSRPLPTTVLSRPLPIAVLSATIQQKSNISPNLEPQTSDPSFANTCITNAISSNSFTVASVHDDVELMPTVQTQQGVKPTQISHTIPVKKRGRPSKLPPLKVLETSMENPTNDQCVTVMSLEEFEHSLSQRPQVLAKVTVTDNTSCTIAGIQQMKKKRQRMLHRKNASSIKIKKKWKPKLGTELKANPSKARTQKGPVLASMDVSTSFAALKAQQSQLSEEKRWENNPYFINKFCKARAMPGPGYSWILPFPCELEKQRTDLSATSNDCPQIYNTSPVPMIEDIMLSMPMIEDFMDISVSTSECACREMGSINVDEGSDPTLLSNQEQNHGHQESLFDAGSAPSEDSSSHPNLKNCFTQNNEAEQHMPQTAASSIEEHHFQSQTPSLNLDITSAYSCSSHGDVSQNSIPRIPQGRSEVIKPLEHSEPDRVSINLRQNAKEITLQNEIAQVLDKHGYTLGQDWCIVKQTSNGRGSVAAEKPDFQVVHESPAVAVSRLGESLSFGNLEEKTVSHECKMANQECLQGNRLRRKSLTSPHTSYSNGSSIHTCSNKTLRCYDQCAELADDSLSKRTGPLLQKCSDFDLENDEISTFFQSLGHLGYSVSQRGEIIKAENISGRAIDSESHISQVKKINLKRAGKNQIPKQNMETDMSQVKYSGRETAKEGGTSLNLSSFIPGSSCKSRAQFALRSSARNKLQSGKLNKFFTLPTNLSHLSDSLPEGYIFTESGCIVKKTRAASISSSKTLAASEKQL